MMAHIRTPNKQQKTRMLAAANMVFLLHWFLRRIGKVDTKSLFARDTLPAKLIVG